MRYFFITFIGLFITLSAFSQATWSLTGNAGTTNSNFVGTTDNKPLIIKVNNQWAGFSGYPENYNVSFGFRSNTLNSGWDNTVLGSQALTNNSTGFRNVAVGSYALDPNSTGSDNVAVGESASGRQSGDVSYIVSVGRAALMNNQKSGNTAVGFEAGAYNTAGEALTAVGYKALNKNSTGNNNAAFGFNALINNTTGFNNTAVGAWTLVGNTTGDYNTTVGMKSLYSNTTGEYNTAIGEQALELNTTGYWNVGLGSGALNQNVTGYLNTAVGTSAMWSNKTGYDNSALGEEALAGNIDGNNNTALGTRSMFSFNLTPTGKVPVGHASFNTAVGFESLREITAGSWNVAVGVHAMRISATGTNNVAVGDQTLMQSTAGNGNVAVGRSALYNLTTGSNNTAIGYGADIDKSDLTNATAIGYGAKATANNQVAIGNSSVTSIRAYAQLSTVSDARIKKNVKANIPGLAFINKLQPITYDWDWEAIQKLLKTNEAPPKIDHPITGFIAQDVEIAAKSVGYNFDGIDMDNSDVALYGLRYSKFVVSLVKAVQELSDMHDAQCAATVALQQQVETLTQLVNKLTGGNTKLASVDDDGADTLLAQNYPNPSNQSTTIAYTLPPVYNSAKIVIIDISGKILKQIPISGAGNNSILVDTRFLPAGTYFYSLCVDNAPVNTKKMMVK